MKKAPGWEKPGDAVKGTWKEDLLRYLGTLFGLRILVETGTCEASTILAVHNVFEQIHSIELSPYYYEISCGRITKDIRNISLYKGNSAKLLPHILGAIPNVPTLFWLDAHSSGGLTADEGDPLPEELRAITELRPDALIVIDDMVDASFGHVSGAGVNIDDWVREYRTGEVLMHKGGYIIPPFED